MLNLKKAAVAVLALTSSAVFAGTMGPICTPGNVTVPCERTAWDFGGYALYLQPTHSANTGYDFFGSEFGTRVNPFNSFYPFERFENFRNYRNHSPDFGWGFKLEASYHFHTGNDLNVNWYHFSRKHNRHHDDFGLVTPVGFFDDFSFGLGDRIHSRFEPKWDAVNVELGQHTDFSEWTSIRFHGGFQWARIAHRHSSVLFAPLFAARFAPIGLGTFDAGLPLGSFNTTYNGFGPRVGFDMNYNVGNGFGVYANTATALLIGSSKFNSATGPVPFVFAPNIGIPGRGSRQVMVPEMDLKLGAKYTYAMAQGDLTADVGYMWVQYWNANHHIVGHVGGNLDSRESNFAVNGVYFGLKWVGNVV